jgi:hypothetical protein
MGTTVENVMGLVLPLNVTEMLVTCRLSWFKAEKYRYIATSRAASFPSNNNRINLLLVEWSFLLMCQQPMPVQFLGLVVMSAPPLELWVWGHWSDFLMAHVLAETMDVWEARAKALSWEEKMV